MGGRAGDIFTEINVTPLTDVFLVLLVIMILISPLIDQTVLKVEPPSTGAKTPPPQKDEPHVDALVEANGQVKINGKVVPADTMSIATAIKEIQDKAGKTDIPLNLQSDAEAEQKYVVAVMDAAAGVRIKQLRILPLKGK
jgi:biopolymer transport protein ExbD/biopolymer transport protein TolR